MSLLRRPGIILWLLAAVALGVAGHNDPLPTRLLAGVLMALPALMRLAFLVGRREAVPVGGAAEVLDTPPEREPLDVGDPRDPLRRPWVARTVAGLILAAAAVALALSLVAGAPRPLPDVALSSPALLHLQRTAVATIGVALLALFAVRAMAGYFPQKLSTTSAEWPATVVAATSQASVEVAGGVRELRETVTALGARLDALGVDLDEHEAQERAELDRAVQLLADTTNQQGSGIAALQSVVARLDPGAAEELGAADVA
ncbi:MAG: hypothetical protein QOJ63_2604 [Solirubrobacteraceae bacterium]|jgi:hypothetical protein|nr:hypothetical protein [Solirubrobacteraceae bacterium]